MKQCVYYFRETLLSSNKLSLYFWFVSNIYKLNIINLKFLEMKGKTSPFSTSLLCHHGDKREGPVFLLPHVAQLLRDGSGPQDNYPWCQLCKKGSFGSRWCTCPGAFSLFRELLKHQCHGMHLLSQTRANPRLETQCWKGHVTGSKSQLRCSVAPDRAAPERLA